MIIWYEGWGSSWATMARPMAITIPTIPSMRSVLLSLAGLRLPADEDPLDLVDGEAIVELGWFWSSPHFSRRVGASGL
jgi:hypothetical protein